VPSPKSQLHDEAVLPLLLYVESVNATVVPEHIVSDGVKVKWPVNPKARLTVTLPVAVQPSVFLVVSVMVYVFKAGKVCKPGSATEDVVLSPKFHAH